MAPAPEGGGPDAILSHRNIAFTITPERDGVRRWTVLPAAGQIGAGGSGVARAGSGAGSFRVAVAAAQAQIDRLLGTADPADGA